MSAMQISLDKVIAQRPELRGTLEAASTRLREQAAGLDEVVQGMVQRGDFARVSSERFFAMASEAIGIGYQQIRETLLPSLDSLLNQRIAKAQRVLMLNVAVSLLALLLIGYLSAGAYFR